MIEEEGILPTIGSFILVFCAGVFFATVFNKPVIKEDHSIPVGKTDSSFRDRYFVVSYYVGGTNGVMGYVSEKSKYPRYIDLEKQVKQSGMIGTFIPIAILELDELSYSTFWQKKHNGN